MREQRGLSQTELAARLQVLEVVMDQQMVSKIERNLRLVTDYEVAAFAKALGVSPGWLLEEFDAEQARDD